MKNKLAALRRFPAVKKVAAAAAVVATAGQASATTVLDAAARTAISTGFTDMRDTGIDVLTTTWPYLLSITALLFAPKIVKRLAHGL